MKKIKIFNLDKLKEKLVLRKNIIEELTKSNRIKNESQLTVSELKKVEEFFNVKLFEDSENINDGLIKIDY